MSQYEVWCHSCKVTFPPETKRCLHCGSRTRPDQPSASMRGARRVELASLPDVPFSYGVDMGAGELPSDPRSGSVPVEPEEEPMRRSLLRAGMTIVWMILLAAGYAWRACSPE